MATITSRKRKDGMRYTAIIRIKRNGKVVRSETETFDKKSQLKVPGALEPEAYDDVTVQNVLE